jgi:photosystem II stability/assembly factor-like uncharacterized protein
MPSRSRAAASGLTASRSVLTRSRSVLVPLLALVLSTSAVAASDFDFQWGNPKPQGNGLRALAFESPLVGYAVGNLGATLSTANGGVTWTVLTQPEFQTELRDVIVLSPGHLLAAGKSPGLFRSTDGGLSWTPVANPSTGTLFHLARIPASNEISAIGDGEVLRSTDLGATWQTRTSPGAIPLRDQFWRDANQGYVVGDGLARQTVNGGLSWQPLPGIPDAPFARFYTDVTFADPLNGWVTEHFTTYRTTDGGASWFQRHGPIGTSPIYQEETLVFDLTHRFVITFLEGAEIWETTTDGLTWTRRYQRQSTEGYTDLERLQDGTFHVSSSFGDLLRSTNGGTSWINSVTSPGDEERTTVSAIEFLPNGRGFAASFDGVWLSTEDQGAHWHAAPTAPAAVAPNSIVFRGELLGLAGGYGTAGQSKMARTTDGGATWTLPVLSPNFLGYPVQIAFPSDQVAFVATHGGQGINYVFRSTDGGATWALRNEGVSTGVRLESIFFVDPNLGFVGGGEFGSNVLWKTTDSGGAWTPVPEAGLFQDAIKDMYWSDANTGVVGGFAGICRTTNGGQSWTQVLADEVTKIDFRDALHGFASSYFSPLVWATTNGGITWELVPTPWEGAPYSLAVTATGFAVAGLGSTILVAQEPGTTGLPDVGASPPVVAGNRVRVWPNPSHGRASTPLAFSITSPTAGPVAFRIFDAAGRLAASHTARTEAGATTIPWQLRSLPSGIYLIDARLPDGRSAEGRMVVLPGP